MDNAAPAMSTDWEECLLSESSDHIQSDNEDDQVESEPCSEQECHIKNQSQALEAIESLKLFATVKGAGCMLDMLMNVGDAIHKEKASKNI